MRAEPIEPAISTPHRTLRALLSGIVDYAGLFPPAGLEMATAAANYAAYRVGPDAWALGRFVVPAARLGELDEAIASVGGADRADPWRVSVLVGPDAKADVERIREHARGGGTTVVDTVELRAPDPGATLAALHELPSGVTAYVEVALDHDPADAVAALTRAGARAKVRTGGVNPDAFPTPGALLRFLRACVDEDLPFKATAGLHHPVAGLYRLGHEPGSASATMYGYLNLLLATALLRRRTPEPVVAAALVETDPLAFRFSGAALSWREHHIGVNEIVALRERGMVAFGSCSFREPLDELVALAAPPP